MSSPDDTLRRQLDQHVAEAKASMAKISSLLAAPSEQPDVRKRPAEPADSAPPSKAPRTTSDGSSLEQLRQKLRDFAVERDWDQFHTPRNIALALVGEVGELAECFQWSGDAGCATGLPDWPQKKKDHLGEELADVLLYLVRLSDKCGVDLPAAAEAKLLKNAAKYPAALVKGSSKKYNEY